MTFSITLNRIGSGEGAHASVLSRKIMVISVVDGWMHKPKGCTGCLLLYFTQILGREKNFHTSSTRVI